MFTPGLERILLTAPGFSDTVPPAFMEGPRVKTKKDWSVVTEKRCCVCGAAKPLVDFFKAPARAHLDGVQSKCKACSMAANKAYMKTPTGREKNREHNFVVNYGLHKAEIARMLAAQDGRCKSCGDVLKPGHGTHVDHSHSCCPGKKSCGKCLRGLLCRSCNLMLGNALDSASRLRAGATYLESFRTEVSN